MVNNGPKNLDFFHRTIPLTTIFITTIYNNLDGAEGQSRLDLRIYKRKQESKKKERKHALDQVADQENDQEKKKVYSFFFLVAFLVERFLFLFFS